MGRTAAEPDVWPTRFVPRELRLIIFTSEHWLRPTPVKAQQKRMAKLLCSYPTADCLRTLGFTLHTWQELAGKDRFDDDQIQTNQCLCHRGGPRQGAMKALTGTSEADRVRPSHTVAHYPGLAGDCLPQRMKPGALGGVGYRTRPAEGNWPARHQLNSEPFIQLNDSDEIFKLMARWIVPPRECGWVQCHLPTPRPTNKWQLSYCNTSQTLKL